MVKKSQGLVSVIMNCHNGEKYLEIFGIFKKTDLPEF